MGAKELRWLFGAVIAVVIVIGNISEPATYGISQEWTNGDYSFAGGTHPVALTLALLIAALYLLLMFSPPTSLGEPLPTVFRRFVICFPIYSTFQGPALFLEDVYVRPQFRDKGIGKALIGEVAAMAMREGCGALQWEVLQWNQPAIDFYKRLGAIFLDDWKAVRIEGEAPRRVAEQHNA